MKSSQKPSSKSELYKIIICVIGIPVFSFLVTTLLSHSANFPSLNSGFGSLLMLILVSLITFPFILTCFLSSVFAYIFARSTRYFFVYWLVPTLLSLLLYTVLSLIPQMNGNTGSIFSWVFQFSLPFLLAFIPISVFGLAIGIFIMSKKTITKHSQPSKVRVICIAVLLGLYCTFLTGVFMNDVHSEHINIHQHYYIHRGIPFAFSGAGRGTLPPLPILRVTFFSESLGNSIDARYYKLVDIPEFLLALLFYSAISLFPAYYVAKLLTNKRRYRTFLGISLFLVLLSFLFWGSLIV